MNNNLYEITSPNFPTAKDFLAFPVWCEWHEAEETSYIRSLCSNEKEFQSKFFTPYEEGKESYYPIIENPLPKRIFLSIAAEITINNEFSLKGYLSTDNYQIIAIHIWLNTDLNKSISILSNSRLFAKDENPKVVKKLKKHLGINSIQSISYKTAIVFANGNVVKGSFEYK